MKSLQYIFTFLFLLSATLISAQTDAEIMLSTDRDSAAMGENIVFVIRLRNAGATALSNIAVNVWISEGLQFVSSTSDKGTSYDKKTGQWNIVIVPKKQTFTTLILKTKVIKDGVNSVYAEVMKMREKDIETRRFFYPGHLQPALKGRFEEFSCPVSEKLWEKGLYLPSSSDLSPDEVSRVAQALKEIFQG
jgi:uncharacterized repeat protein (TIGR01451 family)